MLVITVAIEEQTMISVLELQMIMDEFKAI